MASRCPTLFTSLSVANTSHNVCEVPGPGYEMRGSMYEYSVPGMLTNCTEDAVPDARCLIPGACYHVGVLSQSPALVIGNVCTGDDVETAQNNTPEDTKATWNVCDSHGQATRVSSFAVHHLNIFLLWSPTRRQKIGTAPGSLPLCGPFLCIRHEHVKTIC